MFRKKKQSTVAGIVVNGKQSKDDGSKASASKTGKRSASVRLTGKKSLMVIVLLVFGTAIAIAGIVYMQRQQDQREQQEATQQTVEQVGADALATYDPETGEGHEDAQQVIDDALRTARNDEERAAFYHQKASVYLNAQQYQEALAAAQRAEDLGPSVVSAAFLGHASRGLGRSADAIRYYELAIERINEYEVPHTGDLKYYQDMIDEVRR